MVATGEDGLLTRGRWEGDTFEREDPFKVASSGVPLTEDDYAILLSLIPERFKQVVTREDLKTSSVKSMICGLEAGTDGRIWLRAEDRNDRELWVAHDPITLTPVAEVLVPEGVALKAFGAGLAYGVWRDDLGVDYVFVYWI